MLPYLSPAVVAHIRRTKHRRFYLLLARDPARWLPVLEQEAARAWPPAPAPPSLTAQVGSAARAAWRFARSGFRMADRATARARLAICRPCPERRGALCGVCGCVLAIKVRMNFESCPIGKWSPV